MIFSRRRRDAGHVVGILGRLVLDEIAKARVVAVAHGRLERDGLLRHLHDLLHALDGQVHLVGHFLRRRLVAEFLQELLLHRITLLMVSIMWTGMRMVRAWSAIERVMAWRIHHVA